MTDRSPIMYMLLLIGTVFACVLIGSSLSAAYLLWLGVEEDFNPLKMHEYLKLNEIRIILGINQFFTFLLPGWISYIWWGKRFSSSKASTALWLPFVLILLYFVSLPFFQWVYVWTIEIGAPEWWPFSTQAVPEFLMDLVRDASANGLIANLIVIALLPAVGEELVFRRLGIPLLQRWIRSDHLAILVSALIFAFLHFDFEGLLARTVLGLVLGYAWYFSSKLWVPIMIHFIHNGGQVLLAYYYPEAALTEPSTQDAPSVFFAILSFSCLILVYWQLSKRKKIEHKSTT